MVRMEGELLNTKHLQRVVVELAEGLAEGDQNNLGL
tara:strand:+ start:58 stop:165 length:108 start_codon:yes stop_codon:yes gene_type:complete